MKTSSTMKIVFLGCACAALPAFSAIDQQSATSHVGLNPIEQINFDLDQLVVRHRVYSEKRGQVQKQIREITRHYHAYSQSPEGFQYLWEEEPEGPRDRKFVSGVLKAVLRKNMDDLQKLNETINGLEAEQEWLAIQKQALKQGTEGVAQRSAQQRQAAVFACRVFPLNLGASDLGSNDKEKANPYTILQDFGLQQDKETGLKWTSNGWWLSHPMQAPTGLQTEMRACADGRLVFVGEIRGRGWVVMIDHGDDVFTVYANIQSQLAESLKRGAQIKEGTLLGRSMERVYFEVRVRGKAVDPRAVVPVL